MSWKDFILLHEELFERLHNLRDSFTKYLHKTLMYLCFRINSSLTIYSNLKCCLFNMYKYIQQDATILSWLLFQELYMFQAFTFPS
jgi:hypothetical protein